MDSCRVKDNRSPWPVQAYPLLISSHLISAQSQPWLQLGLGPSGWHSPYIHMYMRTHTHTVHSLNNLVLCLFVNAPFKNVCINASYSCLHLQCEIHLSPATCQKGFVQVWNVWVLNTMGCGTGRELKECQRKASYHNCCQHLSVVS